MNVTLVVGVWIVFGSVTLVLAIYRWVLSAHNQNDVVHLGPGEEKQIPGQVFWHENFTPSTAGVRQ